MKTHIPTPKEMLVTAAAVSTMFFAGKSLKAQDSAIAQSRMDNGAFNKTLTFDQGKYMLAGNATSEALALDSVRISQQIDVAQQTFKFFGNMEVSIKSYENGTLVLQPTDAKFKTFSLKDSQNIDGWTVTIRSVSANTLSLEAFTTNKTVLKGEILEGPAGSINLGNDKSPPYSKAVITSVPAGYAITTDNGPVTFGNMVYHVQIERDKIATGNPVPAGVDFKATGSGAVFDEYIVDPKKPAGYYKDTSEAAVFKKNTITGFFGNKGTAFDWRNVQGKFVLNHNIETDNKTYAYRTRFDIENGITNQTFDKVYTKIINSTMIDSVMESGLLSYLNEASNFRDTVTTGTNGKLQIEIIYNGNDPRNNAVLKLGTPKDIVGVKDNQAQKIQASVSPNPVNEVMTFRREEANSEAILIVRDLLGNTLFKQRLKAGEGEAQIPMKDQAPGMYNVMVISTDARQLFYEKVIKE